MAVNDELMSSYDILITEEGDFELDETNELVGVTGDDLLAQHIRMRLENVNPDWFYDTICADLEDLLGLPNERTTATTGTDMITQSISDVIDIQDIFIQPVPLNKSTILYFVFLHTDDLKPMGFEVKVALGAYVNVRRIQ